VQCAHSRAAPLGQCLPLGARGGLCRAGCPAAGARRRRLVVVSRQRRLVVVSQQQPGRGDGDDASTGDGSPAGAGEGWWESLALTWKEVNEPKFDDDQCFAAQMVRYRLEIIESTKECLSSPDPKLREWAAEERGAALRELLPDLQARNPGLIWMYWGVRWKRLWSSQRLRSSLPALAGVFNLAFVAVFLRLSLPRLLAMQSMGDLGDFAKELGLPSRDELASYLAYADGFDFSTKFAAFTAIFALEKVG
jgi:hypothetical protein